MTKVDLQSVSMYEYLLARTVTLKKLDCISFFGGKITFEQFIASTDLIAESLSSKGIRKGEAVGLCLANIPSALMAFYAINKIGAIANVIHPLTPAIGLYDILKKTNTKLIFSMDIFYEATRYSSAKLGITNVVCSAADFLTGLKKQGYKLATLSKRIKIRYDSSTLAFREILGEKNKNLPSKNCNLQDTACDKEKNISTDEERGKLSDCEREKDKGKETAVYLHSGGTTGKPKTVVAINSALNNMASNLHTVIAKDGKDYVEMGESMLMVLPLFHIFGLGVCMHTALSAGARVVLLPSFKAKQVCETLKAEKVNFISGVPSMYKKMCENKYFSGKHLSCLKCCFCGGDKLSESVRQNFDKLVKESGGECVLSEGYGLSETGVCSVNTSKANKNGSVGIALKGARYCIADKDGSKKKAGDYGEICVSGATVMKEYLGDEKTTNAVFFTDDEGVRWLRTGDCGWQDSEGFLFFKERIKRMVKIGGINVFPSEIEEITRLVEGVVECCAIEVNEQGKSAIRLLLLIESGQDFAKVKDRVSDKLSEKLMKYSIPKYIDKVDSLPMTQIGKVDYKKIK